MTGHAPRVPGGAERDHTATQRRHASTVCCVIPAYREERRVAETVRAVRSLDRVDRVIVVDDGSGDDTARSARSAGAEVVRLERNVGKGGALEAGLQRADPCGVTLLLDADLGDSATQADALLDPVLEGAAGMSVAVFPRPAGKAGFGLVKGLARWGIRRLGGGFESRAPLSGQRALDAATLDAVRPFATGFGVELAMTVRALRAGRTVVEVETSMAHAPTGRDLAGFAHRGRQFLHVLRALTALWVESISRPSR